MSSVGVNSWVSNKLVWVSKLLIRVDKSRSFSSTSFSFCSKSLILPLLSQNSFSNWAFFSKGRLSLVSVIHFIKSCLLVIFNYPYFLRIISHKNFVVLFLLIFFCLLILCSYPLLIYIFWVI